MSCVLNKDPSTATPRTVPTSRLVVVADCEVIRPEAKVSQADLAKIELIKAKTRDAGETNHYGYSQYFIDPAKN